MKTILHIFLILLAGNAIFAQTPELDSLQQLVNIAFRSYDRRAQADALEHLARRQAETGNPFEALQNVQLAIDLYQALGDQSEAYKSYTTIITVHQQLHNGEKILEYTLPALAWAREHRDTAVMLHMLNAAGVGYSQTGQHEKATKHYLQCLELEKQYGGSCTYAAANVSSSSLEGGNPDRCLEYADLTIRLAAGEQDTFSLAIGYICQACAWAKKGNAAAAETAIANLERLAPALPERVIQRELAVARHLMHAARGDFRQAYEQHQLFHQIDSTLSSVERNAHFAQLEAIYNTKKKEVENARLSASNQRKNFWIGGAVAAALLLGVIVFLLRKRLIINAKLLETEKALAEAERIRAAELQAHYERELADFTRILIEKNQALEALQATQLPGNDDSQPSKDLHSELLRSTILTDADWRNFRQKFERVHPGFFEKISREVPDATEAERRLAALTRLELSNAEIAAMLGISPESVVKTRYRLRKKLGERELEEVVKI